MNLLKVDDDVGDYIEFSDIVDEKSSDDFNRKQPKYRLEYSNSRKEWDNANAKTLAWTDSLEFEGGQFLALTAEPVIINGSSHKYQFFMYHRSEEKTFRERDGVFISEVDNAVILHSAKARFGIPERTELLQDIHFGNGEFVISDWLFQTNARCKGKTLYELPGFEKFKGKRTFRNFIGVRSSPLISQRVLDLSSRDVTAPITLMSRNIFHDYHHVAATIVVPFLFTRKIIAKLFIR